MNKKNLLILVNPQAGSARSSAPLRASTPLYADVLDALGANEDCLTTTTENDHGAGIVRQALKKGVTHIVVIGGDGSISQAIQGFFENGALINPRAILMIMPQGRGNDFFKSMLQSSFFDRKKAWKKGLEQLRQGTPQWVDVARYTWLGANPTDCHYFINVTSFGFPGLVVNRVQAKERFLNQTILGQSLLTYGAHSFTALRDYRPLHTLITVDGHPCFDHPLLAGFLLNGQCNSGGIYWDPRARLDDGLFHLVLWKPNSPLRLLKNFGKTLAKQAMQMEDAVLIQGKKIKIEIHPNEIKTYPFFEIDGDCLESHGARGAEFELLHQAIQIQF